MRAAWVTLLLGCNMVLGLQDRDRAADDAGLDTAIDDTAIAENDTAVAANDTSVDTGFEARPPNSDTGATMDTAPPSACGVKPCAAGQQCYVAWNSSTDAYSVGCAPVSEMFESKPFGPCVTASPNVFVCSAGFACGWQYPGRKVCLPLCGSGTAACPMAAPYCNYQITEVVSRCGQCNPRGTGAECAATPLKTRCMVVDSVGSPVCTTFGARTQGMACKGPTDCAPGYACECTSASGGRLGNECATEADGGICRQLCAGSGAGCPAAGLSCSAVGTTGYSVCR
jgi:hypothetical protein